MITLSRQQLLVNEIMDTGFQYGITGQYTEDATLDGRIVTIHGQEKINFGHCSYMGLETDERLKRGSIRAIERFGTQFSSSRSYISLGLYEALEAKLETLFGQPTIVGPTTTLSHFSVLPTFITEQDTVILDHFAHSSIRLAAQYVQASGTAVEVVPHNDLNQLENRIQKHLAAGRRHIWYLVDGVYSMQGDVAPLRELQQLQQRYEQLYLYIDDAHGMSWTGQHGRGYALEQLGGLNDQTFLVTSFAKAFATGGGAIVCPSELVKKTIRNCGRTLMFSGPLQPAQLGAALASADLHLSAEIYQHQDHLKHRIQHFNRRCRELGLALVGSSDTPIRYIGVGLPEIGYEIVSTLIARGFFLNIASFPSVAKNKTGLRITLSNHTTVADIDRLLETTARVVEQVFERHEYRHEQVLAAFA